MFLSSISLKKIRRHIDTNIEFVERLNYIVGGNGVGKTTIIEAIYYLCTTKSCITSTDSEAVKLGEDGFRVVTEIETPEAKLIIMSKAIPKNHDRR